MVHQRFTQHAHFVASSHQPTHGLNEEETVETILWSRRGYRKKLAPYLVKTMSFRSLILIYINI
ncbi:hypothetical protein L484_005012 [Morus notabilis]|uniref:Uncharacterized protein n=1 Tax=Morus notabilis TaxID=981085 RepID=W9RZZ4_9ROSA|nr:hypothetical protein L484_005012 [Morus notabilis]